MAGLNASIPLAGDTSGASSAAPIDGVLAGAVLLEDAYKGSIAKSVLGSDIVNVGEAIALLDGKIVTEVLILALNDIPNMRSVLTSVETLMVADALLKIMPATLSEAVGVSDAQVALQVATVIDALGLAGVLLPSLLYGQPVTDSIVLGEALTRFFGLNMTEALGIGEVHGGMMSVAALVADNVDIGQSLGSTLLLRVTAADTVSLTAAQALNALYTGQLADVVDISAAHVLPGNSFTTWAMNTRTAAVTEYSNYAFNSFAKLGDKYLGASDSGLYELVGDDDDGDDIVARIKSGFAQFAGTHHTLFKAAYLGVRGEGDFVFRLVSGEGQTYDYAVSTRDMRSTKVHMGKGLRARYFAFELISAGQDFDLDTIEFVPLVAQRRV